MICPNCGTEIADGSPSCPACGTPFMMQPQEQAPYYAAAPEKKSKTGLIIGIIVGVVAIAAIIVCLKLFVFGGHSGTYVCDDYSAFGMEMTIEVKGSKFTMTMSYDDETQEESGTIKFKGDEVTMTVDGEDLPAEYDSKDKTITISDDSLMGMELVFKKK